MSYKFSNMLLEESTPVSVTSMGDAISFMLNDIAENGQVTVISEGENPVVQSIDMVE